MASTPVRTHTSRAPAQDLVNHCLTVDPKKRFTAKQVLSFKWIQGHAPDTAIDRDCLKKFQASRKLKAAAAKIMAMKKTNIANLATAAKAQAEVGK